MVGTTNTETVASRLNGRAAGVLTIVGPLPPPAGGMSIFNARLTDELRARGWRVSLLATGREEPAGWPVEAHLRNSLLRHFFLVLRHATGIVHVHDRVSPLTLCAVVAVRLRRLRVVVQVHGEPLHVLTRRRGIDIFRRAALRLADCTIAVNSHVAEQIRAYAHGEIFLIPAFIEPTGSELDDIDAETARWLGSDPGTPLLSAVVYRALAAVSGRTDVYGLDALASLVERIAPRRRVRLALMLAQPGLDNEEQRYIDTMTTRLSRALGDDLKVLVGASAVPVIARSSLFLRPTRTDGDAVSVREALSLGVPVLASDVAPRPPGTVVYRQGDLEELTAKALALLGSGRSSDRAHGAHATVEALERVYSSLSAR